MALDFLSIPGRLFNTCSYILWLIVTGISTSVDVERIFSRGRLVLSHLRSRLSVQSTRAVLCLGSWSKMGLIKDSDVLAITRMPELGLDEEDKLEDGWDDIIIPKKHVITV